MKKPRIAVIGAGLAGLTAAYRLIQKGCDVNLFEARNRVGGRVLTAFMKNYLGNTSIIEFGGQNITDGGEAQYFMQLVREFDLEVETKEIELNGRVYHEGEYFEDQKLLQDYLKDHPNIEENINSVACRVQSMQDLIDELFRDYPVLRKSFISKMSSYEGVHVSRQSVYHNIDTFLVMMQGGIAKAHESYQRIPHHVVIKSIKGGNAQLPLKIAERLGDRLRLNKILDKVAKINNEMHLSFKDGTTDIYDFVIMAVPASVYGDIQFINYDDEDMRQIQLMQQTPYGDNYKVACPFHLNASSAYRFILTDEMISFPNQDETISFLYVNQPIADMKRVIEIVKTGLGAQTQQNMDEILASQDQQYITYTQPTAHIWPQDIFAKGSYSGYAVSLSKDLDEKTIYEGTVFKKLFKPIQDHLFFIGEHTTILEYIGTMEAAVESGERAADVIFKKVFSLDLF